jgi:hypothetical protein
MVKHCTKSQQHQQLKSGGSTLDCGHYPLQIVDYFCFVVFGMIRNDNVLMELLKCAFENVMLIVLY